MISLSSTVDDIVLGDGAVPVKGVATTMMATFEVVKRCVAGGINLIVSHETPVYMHQDNVKQVANDPAYLAKKEFVEQNRAASSISRDHWHVRQPDGIATGMIQDLGWERNVEPASLRRFTFLATPLAQFAKAIWCRRSAAR